MKKTKDKKRDQRPPVCQACSFGTCCSEGVELDLLEVATILKEANLSLPKPWFSYLGRDKSFPSGYKFTTLVREGSCIFQDRENRCRIYPIRPRFCVEFPLEGGKKAPYYHELCYHGKKRRAQRAGRKPSKKS